MHQDFFTCVKQIGVLEYLHVPDIEAYSGLAYHMAGEYKQAVELFEKVDHKSPLYGQIIRSLAIDYMYLGDYLALDKTSLEKYRVPGAHTGYLPFSVAKEARDYVKRNLELIETWFV